MSTHSPDEREFWMRVRRGHLAIVRAIESKYAIQEGPTMKLVRVVSSNYRRPVDSLMQVEDAEANRLIARGVAVLVGTVHIEVVEETPEELTAKSAEAHGVEESHQTEKSPDLLSDDDDDEADDGEE